jgi:hypothetical protein
VTAVLLFVTFAALAIGYVIGHDEANRRRLRPLVRADRSDSDRRVAVALGSAVRTPVQWRRDS